MASKDFVAIPGLKPGLELYDVYETYPKIYIVASDMSRETFRVLKIDRLVEDELSLTEDSTEYTRVQANMLLDMLRGAFRNDDKKNASGGFRRIVQGYGILGFIRFTKGYNMVVITKRRKVAVLGPHIIYEIADTEFLPLNPAKPSRFKVDDEARYKELFMLFDTKKDFYFSYTYDLSHTLQFNCQRRALQKTQPAELAQYDDMFVYNSYLLRPLQAELSDCNSPWVLPCIHGSLSQITLDAGVKIRLILIARRSRYFAGTRYLKRGISEEGHVANHIETEQIVYDASSLALCGTLGYFSSFVQLRGSIPIYWYQSTEEQRVHKIRPPIKLGRSDPGYAATKLHFSHLMCSYGTPIIAVDLLKQKEKVARESILGAEYSHVVDAINKEIPKRHAIGYIAWDFRHASRLRDKVANEMTSIAEESLLKTGFFTTGPTSEQRGIVRTNCVDCLDRTNLAQFFVGKCALGQQLQYLGVANKDFPIVDQLKVTGAIFDQYIIMGDRIALQYGGSRAVSAGVLDRWDLLTSLARYYRNHFVDMEKQKSMNIFLGNYTPTVAMSSSTHDTPTGEAKTPIHVRSSASAADLHIHAPPPAHSDDPDTPYPCKALHEAHVAPFVEHPGDAIIVGRQYAFLRPMKFLLPRSSKAEASAKSVASPAVGFNAGGGATGAFMGYSYPSRDGKARNGSFSFAPGDNINNLSDSFARHSRVAPALPGGNEDTASVGSGQVPGGQWSEKRVIDLWDIENDYYLHLQDGAGVGTFIYPPCQLTKKWWEVPLVIFAARLVTAKIPFTTMLTEGFHTGANPLLWLQGPGWALTPAAAAAPARGMSAGTITKPLTMCASYGSLNSSNPSGESARQLGNTINSVRHQSALPRNPSISPDFTVASLRRQRQGASSVALNMLHTDSQAVLRRISTSNLNLSRANHIVRSGDAGIALRHPLDAPLLPPEDEIRVTDEANEQADVVLTALRSRFEGKFTQSTPYSWPLPTITNEEDQSWKAVTGMCNLDNAEDVHSDSYKLYEEYCEAADCFEQNALWDLAGRPWKKFMAACRRSRYNLARDFDKQQDAWMVSWSVKRLLASDKTLNAKRLVEVDVETSALQEYAPKSLAQYERFVSQITDDELTKEKYEEYVQRPLNVQQDLSAIEADALQNNGVYFTDSDSGPVVQELNCLFGPFLDYPEPDQQIEEALRKLVEKLHEGLCIAPRIRFVKGAQNAGGKLKNTQTGGDASQSRAEVFQNTFLARQAIDFILKNVSHLDLSAKTILFCHNPKQQVIRLLDYLMKGGIFNVATPSDSRSFVESFTIYRFLADEALHVLNAENSVTPTYSVNVDPVELSQGLLRNALQVYRRFLALGEHESLHNFIQTPVFRHFAGKTNDLQAVNLSVLKSDESRIAFWANVHNTLEIHAQLTIGCAFTMHHRVYLATSAYLVGGFVVSLDEIQHGILRGNRRAPIPGCSPLTHRVFRPFMQNDPRRKLAVREPDNRVHFVVLQLTSYDLPNFVDESLAGVDRAFTESMALPSTLPQPQSTTRGADDSPVASDSSPTSMLMKAARGLQSKPAAPSTPQTRQQLDMPDLLEDDEEASSGDESLEEQRYRPIPFWQQMRHASKKTVQKPPINVVLEVETLDAQLKDITAKTLQWGVQVVADPEFRQLSLPSLFFDYSEDFGILPHEKVRHAFVLLSGSAKRKLARFCQSNYTLKCLPRQNADWRA
ncbi:Polyphosphoinositide phosphatase [Diplonema papillatum]|nr:Polyphosphoinositide phosphatase [Diplonema papillatum]